MVELVVVEVVMVAVGVVPISSSMQWSPCLTAARRRNVHNWTEWSNFSGLGSGGDGGGSGSISNSFSVVFLSNNSRHIKF